MYPSAITQKEKQLTRYENRYLNNKHWFIENNTKSSFARYSRFHIWLWLSVFIEVLPLILHAYLPCPDILGMCMCTYPTLSSPKQQLLPSQHQTLNPTPSSSLSPNKVNNFKTRKLKVKSASIAIFLFYSILRYFSFDHFIYCQINVFSLTDTYFFKQNGTVKIMFSSFNIF